MSAAPTPSQVRALVAELRRKRPHDRAVAIRSAGRWTGDPTLTWNGETWLIRQCDSPLAVRLALREEAPDGAVRVILTPVDAADPEMRNVPALVAEPARSPDEEGFVLLGAGLGQVGGVSGQQRETGFGALTLVKQCHRVDEGAAGIGFQGSLKRRSKALYVVHL